MSTKIGVVETPSTKSMIVMGDGSATNGKVDWLEPRLFEIKDGQRRPIDDPRTFYAEGHDGTKVRVIPEHELEQWPLDPRSRKPRPGELITVKSPNDFLGGGHYMQTTAALRKVEAGAHVDATTRTWNITILSGFHGAAKLVYYDAAGVCVGMSSGHTFGVDGTWIGRSDRTDFWSEDIPRDLAVKITGFAVCHFWDPWTLEQRIARAVRLAQTIADAIKEIIAIGGQVSKS